MATEKSQSSDMAGGDGLLLPGPPTWLASCSHRLYKAVEALTVVMFTAIIGVFVLQIFSRYVLRDPIIWSLELAGILYIWTALLSVCFLAPFSVHIRFLLIRKAPLGFQRLACIVTLLLLGVSLLLLVPDTLDLLRFLARDHSTTLRIPMDKVFLIYLLFLLVIALRAFCRIGGLLGRNWRKYLL